MDTHHVRIDADSLQVVHHPLFVPHLLVHVLVEVVADLPVRVGNAAGGRRTNRVEVPDHVVQLEQEAAIALHRHAVGHRVEDHRVCLESAARFISADHQVREERQHQLYSNDYGECARPRFLDPGDSAPPYFASKSIARAQSTLQVSRQGIDLCATCTPHNPWRNAARALEGPS